MYTRWHGRRWIAVGCIAVAGLAAGGLGMLAIGRATAPHPRAEKPASAGGMAMRGLRSWIDRGEGMRVRVEAESVRLVRPQVFGPFRLGFARALEGRGVTVESFEGAQSGRAAKDPSQQLGGLLSAVVPASWMRRVVSAEARDVTLIRHRPDGATATLTARECRSTTPPGAAVCRDGTIREGSSTWAFAEAACDRDGCTITQAAARR